MLKGDLKMREKSWESENIRMKERRKEIMDGGFGGDDVGKERERERGRKKKKKGKHSSAAS